MKHAASVMSAQGSGSIVVIGSAFIALNGFVGTRFVSLAFPISASAVALTALFQPKHKESVYHA